MATLGSVLSTAEIPVGGVAVNAGTATLNFGPFPGATDALVVITEQSGIVAGSRVQACVRLEATADHSIDEHWVEDFDINAGNNVAGVGFTIYGRTRNHRLYGLWNVAWIWS